jgi:hypothetical protein
VAATIVLVFVVVVNGSLFFRFVFLQETATERPPATVAPGPKEPPNWEPNGCFDFEADFLGYSDALDGKSYEGTKVGALSGLTYDPGRNVYYALADGGVESTPARFYTLKASLEEGKLADPLLSNVTTLRNAQGKPFTGADFDGEDIAITREDEILIASETEPSIRRFSLQGRHLAELTLPQKFLVEPKGYARDNGTLESLALAPNDDPSLFTANEDPLTIDGPDSSEERRPLRILRYKVRRSSGRFEPAQEFFYLTQPGQSVGAIAALSEHEFFVLERGERQIFRVSLDEGVDVSGEENLATSRVEPLKKELLVDLDYCEMPGYDEQPYGHLEGLELGPELPKGRRMLLLQTDDDFTGKHKTRTIALGIRAR